MFYEILLGVVILLSVLNLILIADIFKRKSNRVLSEQFYYKLSKEERKELCLLIIEQETNTSSFEKIFNKLTPIEKRDICLEAIDNNKILLNRKDIDLNKIR